MADAPAAPAPLTAFWGDSWQSPWWVVIINGVALDTSVCAVTAQARERLDDPTPTFQWHTTTGGIVFGTAELELPGGAKVERPALQLRMRPADWEDKPRTFSGQLDVQISSDATTDPDFRHTIVRRRRFIVTGDVAR